MVDRRLRHSTPRVTCLLHDVHSGEDHKDGEDHCADGVCDLSLVTEGPGPGGQRRGMDVWHGVVHREGGGENKGEVSSATHAQGRIMGGGYAWSTRTEQNTDRAWGQHEQGTVEGTWRG